MKRMRKALHRLALSIPFSRKVVLLILLAVALPLITLGEYALMLQRRHFLEESRQQLSLTLDESARRVNEMVTDLQRTGEAALSDVALLTRLRRLALLKSPKQFLEVTLKESLQMAERLAYANPDVHALRLFIDDARIPTAPPTLYSLLEMRQRPWYTVPFPADGRWLLDIAEEGIPAESPAGDCAVLLRQLYDGSGAAFGVMELSVPMDHLFADLYQMSDDRWTVFQDSTRALHYDKEGTGRLWRSILGSVVYEGAKSPTPTLLELGGHTLLVMGAEVPALGGRLISAQLLDAPRLALDQRHLVFFILAGAVLLLTALLSTRLVHRLLRRFRTLMRVAKELQRGNLSVEVPEMGGDEFGELATDLRETSVRFRELLQTTINREMLVKTTEIRALQNQINSHFIYNVLVAIQMMAELNEQYVIADAVNSLGNLLRYSMKWVSSTVALQDELDYIQDYIALLNLRYDFVIHLHIEMEDELRQQRIPKMSLQPIVENAVRHGIEELSEDAVLRIHGVTGPGYFEVEITDSGAGIEPERLALLQKQIDGLVRQESKPRGGIGLRNVQERIQLSHGPSYGLRVLSEPGRYTKVIVRLPKGEH